MGDLLELQIYLKGLYLCICYIHICILYGYVNIYTELNFLYIFRVFEAIALFFGIAVQAYLIGQITTNLSEMNKKKNEFRQTMDTGIIQYVSFNVLNTYQLSCF